MYIFAEPVTEEQVAEIQSQNDAEIQKFERKILGLTHGKDSDMDGAPEIVQKAMQEDEIFEDVSGIDKGTEGNESNSNFPEVFEQGPLYARKSVSGAGDGANSVSAVNEEVECENEEGEENEENKDDGDGNGNGNGEIEESRRQEGPDEFLNDEGEELNEDDGPSEKSRQQVTNEEPSTNAEGEGQQEYQTRIFQPLPEPTNEEVVQAETAATSSGSQGLLAMTLELRNKVNGRDVYRPLRMSAADEWSVEYSLTELSTPKRARELYEACQLRRRKKLNKSVEEEKVPDLFIQNLRRLSQKGRDWRKKQNAMDEERPVQVLAEKEALGAAARNGAS